MKKPMVRIHNVTTNEIIDREMTDDEFLQHQAQELEHSEKNAKRQEKEELRQATLNKLGLSTEEIAALLS